MPDHVGDLTTIAKHRIFDQVASPVVHADPAGLLFVPRDEKGWPTLDPERSGVHGSSLLVVGLMLLWGVTGRATAYHDASESLLHASHHLVEGIDFAWDDLPGGAS